jgi:Peptidase M76 family
VARHLTTAAAAAVINNEPQIRAASLSGDCRWGRELRRGKYTFTKQHQVRLRVPLLCVPQQRV